MVMVMENFHEIIKGRLAGMVYPKEDDLAELSKKFAAILSLTEELINPPANMVYHHIPIEDFSAPSIDQLCEAVEFIESVDSVVVHCSGGNGRTGTILAAYLIYANRMSADEAMEYIRKFNPSYIETREQEDSLREFEKFCKTLE